MSKYSPYVCAFGFKLGKKNKNYSAKVQGAMPAEAVLRPLNPLIFRAALVGR
jgi:hypothetical protein